MKILHLTGAQVDHGGILSFLRALSGIEIPGIQHSVWVNSTFAETRGPALNLRRGCGALDEAGSPWPLVWSAFRAWPGLRRLLESEPFDVIHAHTRGSFLLACRLHRRRRRPGAPPVVFTNHAYARRTRLYRTAARNWGLPSVALTERMAAYYGLVDASGRPIIEVISACCSEDFFLPPPPAKTRLQFSPEEPLRLVGLGSLVRWKGWNLALEALGHLSPNDRSRVRFELWGPTVEDTDSQAFAAELDAQRHQRGLANVVTLAGSTQNSQTVLQAADWLLHPAQLEPCSLALMESLALGHPAVASASGGSADIVAHGLNGRHFEPGNAADLARQLEQILAGAPLTLDPIGIRESVRARSARQIANRYADLYRRLASRKSKI